MGTVKTKKDEIRIKEIIYNDGTSKFMVEVYEFYPADWVPKKICNSMDEAMDEAKKIFDSKIKEEKIHQWPI